MKKDLIAIVRRHVTSRLARAPDRDAFACTILGRSLRTALRPEDFDDRRETTTAFENIALSPVHCYNSRLPLSSTITQTY